MKVVGFLGCCAVLLTSSVEAFTHHVHPRQSNAAAAVLTKNYMFSGAGASAPKEDDTAKTEEMEQAAKAMGMSVQEYQLGINARESLNRELGSMRLVNGNRDTVFVERDGHNPSQFLKVTITEAGKALGQAEVSRELCGALKAGADASRKGRADAQQNMMKYISEGMKDIA